VLWTTLDFITAKLQAKNITGSCDRAKAKCKYKRNIRSS
jgi:hypothetical protein